MTIKLQGTWEAERVAAVLERFNPVSDFGQAWAKDCAARMRRQIEAEKNRRKDND